MSSDDDDWARAEAELARVRPEPPDRRARRRLVERRLTVLGRAVTATAVGVLLVLLVVDGGSLDSDEEPPTWRGVSGLALQVVGLVLMLGAYVAHSGAVRHTRGWARPMHWLSRSEHRDLLRQVRGRRPLVPGQLQLARHAARSFLVQRPPTAAPSAFLLVAVGQYVAAPGTVRFVLAAAMSAVVVAAHPYERRDERRVRRFLDEHPGPSGTQCTNRRPPPGPSGS